MGSFLLLILVIAFAGSTSALSKLTNVLLAEGLLSMEEYGLPETVCLLSPLKDGSARIQLCPVTEGFGPRSVGCFAVWNGTDVLQQGCYSNQEIALRTQCKKGDCSADRNDDGVVFCCCFGALCNAART